MGIRNEYVAEGIYPGLSSCLKVAEPNGHTVVFYHSMKQVEIRNEFGTIKALPMRNTHQFNGIPPIKIDHMTIK